mmetsp:Transcript_25614/g.53947  ORF Transcript_25614/g.53947 Transcript_25614/m.53947 type:complete len:230 (-) Transcript_25614:885-1574(-)
MSCRESYVPGAQSNLSVGQFQCLQTRLGVTRQEFVFLVRRFGGGNFDEFDFLELMGANQSLGITTRTTRFGPETRGPRDIRKRQILFFKNSIGVQIGNGDFRRGNQKGILAVASVRLGSNGKQVFLEFWQLGRTLQGGSSYKVRHTDFGVPVLAGVQVEKEHGQRPLQSGDRTAQSNEACSAHLHRRFGLVSFESHCDVVVPFRFEIFRPFQFLGQGSGIAPLRDDLVL